MSRKPISLTLTMAFTLENNQIVDSPVAEVAALVVGGSALIRDRRLFLNAEQVIQILTILGVPEDDAAKNLLPVQV